MENFESFRPVPEDKTTSSIKQTIASLPIPEEKLKDLLESLCWTEYISDIETLSKVAESIKPGAGAIVEQICGRKQDEIEPTLAVQILFEVLAHPEAHKTFLYDPRIARGTEFRNLIRQHEDITKEIKRRQAHKDYGNSESLQSTVFNLDHRRHELHEEILAKGKNFDLTSGDIMFLFMLEHGSLEEYGLDAAIIQPDDEAYESFPEQCPVKQNEIMIQFGAWSSNGDHNNPKLSYSDRIKEATAAAKQLAADFPEEVRYVKNDNGGYHSSAGSLGIAIPKDKLPEYVRLIKENRAKYWY
ncbi:MAG: hypothetical protein WCJ29_01565 [bacterium]